MSQSPMARRAFGTDIFTDPPQSFRDLGSLPVVQKKIVSITEIDQVIKELL